VLVQIVFALFFLTILFSCLRTFLAFVLKVRPSYHHRVFCQQLFCFFFNYFA